MTGPQPLGTIEREYRWLSERIDLPGEVGDFLAVRAEHRCITDTYFDTPDFRLHHMGSRLRIRIQPPKRFVTFKGGSTTGSPDGYRVRPELEVAADGDIEGTEPFLIARRLVDGELTEIGTITNNRYAVTYTGPSEQEVEIAVDDVDYGVGAREWRLEAEGPEPAVHLAARALTAMFPFLRPAPFGKVQEMLIRRGRVTC
ncbi:CYTH domain-containing protein [Nonomuraea angiospora]|uniref:Uncharacterized protein YjbK n=1 Tax=Nonomuraea angiospora TaxID=46172 RepID=A0ABR9LNR6_9ACTN|nr:CYTH domain-containing protein [Nonomuraea angiospora]MBE1582307.1 uncharacterized protein YjbK [Nonomuraea angiospora]